MYKCIVHMRPRGGKALKFPPFVLGFACCVFSVVLCNTDLSLCAVVCMALTVQEHRGYTPDYSVLFPLISTLESMGKWVKFTGQKLRGTCPGVSDVSSVRVRKSCVSANTEEMSTVQRLASSLTPSVSP